MSQDMQAARAALAAKRKAVKRRPLELRAHARRNGIPPHPSFDLATLPGSALLTVFECAQVLRKSLSTLRKYQHTAGHPLRFEKIAGRPMCRVGALRDFIAGKKP